MIDPRLCAGLAQHARAMLGPVIAEKLEGDNAPQLAIEGAIDTAGATAPAKRIDPIARRRGR